MKYGIYGGAFDPMHLEHYELIKRAKEELSLDKIVVVPSGNAPHKSTMTSYADRVNMIKLTVDEDVLIDDVENTLSGLTNTARILPVLKEKYGDIVFIMGGDSFFDIEKWIKPEVVLSFPIAVVPRAGSRDALVEKAERYNSQGKNIKVLRYVGKDVSSTFARTKLYLRLPCDVVSPKCYEYAIQNRIYGKYYDMLDKLAAALTPKRFRHSLNVAVEAVKLNEQLKLDYDKVMTAAILHDASKYSTRPHPELPENLTKGPIAHAFIGAEEIQTDYGIRDEDIINAVRYHTTGRANMSDLEKLIYLADLLEEDRAFDGVEKLREIAHKDFNAGFVQAVEAQLKYLGEGEDVCPLTLECFEFYKNK
ncbi:MAG: bis(5'-nucleosyl)-tetraphosphatase (symmetrical) YqeK [Clostridia bacterium]|nr:bis(5'-nucleosyl)-tetraphosphatase (symmetrical) YqeK [Clostridia bacterium]